MLFPLFYIVLCFRRKEKKCSKTDMVWDSVSKRPFCCNTFFSCRNSLLCKNFLSSYERLTSPMFFPLSCQDSFSFSSALCMFLSSRRSYIFWIFHLSVPKYKCPNTSSRRLELKELTYFGKMFLALSRTMGSLSQVG